MKPRIYTIGTPVALRNTLRAAQRLAEIGETGTISGVSLLRGVALYDVRLDLDGVVVARVPMAAVSGM